MTLADKSPWGMVDFSVHRDTSFVSSIQDIYGEALGMITSVFPQHYQKAAAMILTAVAAAWSAGALTGLLMRSFAGLNAMVAKKISGDLVSKVINPDAAMKAVSIPQIPPSANMGDLVASLMKPINGMKARSAKGDPIDGVGKALSTAVHKLGDASKPGATAGALDAAKQELKRTVTAVGQLQTNMAVLVTLAFTNELRAAIIVPRNTTGMQFSQGWTPDQWFAWVQSLPRDVNAHTLPRPTLPVVRYRSTQADYKKCLNATFFWGVNKQQYCANVKPVSLPSGYNDVGPCMDCRTGQYAPYGMGRLNTAAQQRLAISTAKPINTGAIRRAQSAPTARRDCLRVYFRAAGIQASLADWLQAAIDKSEDASAKARAGGNIIDVVLPAVRDAVKDAAALHALPAALNTPDAQAHRPGQLAPLLTSATLIAKGIATGAIAL